MKIEWLRQRPTQCMLAGIVVFGFLVRLPWIGYCMTPDEAYVFDGLIRRGVRAAIFGPYGSGNHVFNTLASWFTYSIFGWHDWVLQLPALVFGMASIPLAYVAGTAFFGSPYAGLAGAFLMSVAPFHVAYSANSRGYSAEIFFALLATLFVERNLRRPSIAGFLVLASATFLMGLSQLSSLIMFSTWGLILTIIFIHRVRSRERRSWRGLLPWFVTCVALSMGLALVNLGYSPVFSLYRGILARVFQGHWSPDINTFLCAAEQTFWHPFWRFTETNTGLQGQAFWATSAVALLGVATALQKRRFEALIPLAAIACPIASYLVLNLKLEPRYTMIMLPFWAMAFGAGMIAIVGFIGWLAQRVRLSRRPVCLVQGTVFVGMATAYCALIFPLYSRTPELACAFNDYKSAAKYVAANVRENDIMEYEPGISHALEHYLCRYVFPSIPPSEKPSQNPRVWFFATASGPNDLEGVIPGYVLSLVSSFNGCYVWSGELNVPNLHKVDLAPFHITDGVGRPERLTPWLMTSMTPDIEIEVGDELDNPSSRCLQVTTGLSEPDWRLYCPPRPCPANKLVVFRADARDTAGLWATGIFLQFFDEQHNRIEERLMRVPGKSIPGTLWKRYRLARIAPTTARYVSVGLLVSAPSQPGRTTAFRNVELWMDEPPAPEASGGN